MMAEAVYASGFLDFRPSLVAAGVLTSARRAAGAWPFWPSSLAALTGAPPPPPSRPVHPTHMMPQKGHRSDAIRCRAARK